MCVEKWPMIRCGQVPLGTSEKSTIAGTVLEPQSAQGVEFSHWNGLVLQQQRAGMSFAEQLAGTS